MVPHLVFLFRSGALLSGKGVPHRGKWLVDSYLRAVRFSPCCVFFFLLSIAAFPRMCRQARSDGSKTGEPFCLLFAIKSYCRVMTIVCRYGRARLARRADTFVGTNFYRLHRAFAFVVLPDLQIPESGCRRVKVCRKFTNLRWVRDKRGPQQAVRFEVPFSWVSDSHLP